jgi:glycosyltransferase involved in cell wall biosynthesis
MRAGKKIRVLQVIGSLNIGGAEAVLSQLATALDPEEFDVSVCCTRAAGPVADRLRSQGVTVRLAASSRRAFRHLTTLGLVQQVRAAKAHVVHTHGSTALVHAGPLGAARFLPSWVHTFHYGNYPKPASLQASLERWMSPFPRQLVAVSESQRQSIVGALGVDPDRIMTIINGVSANPHVNDPELKRKKRLEFGLSPEDFVVGCVAVLSEQKGISYLLKAASRVAMTAPNIKFLLIGGGPLEKKLRDESAALGLDKNVLFTGWRQDALEIMPSLDVFVMSSLWEAMSIVLLEAMAAGRPIVVTSVGDNSRVVEHEKSGLVVQPKDADAIAAAVLSLYNDPALANRLATQAAARYQDHYSVGRMIAEHERLYRSLAQA